MSGDLTPTDALRLMLAAVLFCAGAGLCAAGVIGQARFGDFYARLHAGLLAQGLGAVVFLGGLAVAAPDWRSFVKIVVFAVIVGALAPVTAHLFANAAHTGGLAPGVGDGQAGEAHGSGAQESQS